MVKDRTDVGDNGNLTLPLVSGSIIDEALKQAGFADDTKFVSDFKKYREIEQQAREIQLKSLEAVSKHVQKGSNIDEAMKKVGFTRNDELQSVLDNVISKAKKDNPYFPFGKPFEDLIKEDEDLDDLLMVKGYKIDGNLLAYHNDLQKHKVSVLLDKIGIGLKGLYTLLNGMCFFLKENTEKPTRIQNKIKDCLDNLNEYPGCGQVIQILFLQGIIEWFEHCDIDEKSKGYDEAQILCNWVYERLMDVCLYYFMLFNKNSDSEPLDNYLATTQIGEVWNEIKASQHPQQETHKNQKIIILPNELDTDGFKKILKAAIEDGFVHNDYTWNKSKSKQLAAYFAQKACEHLNINTGTDKDGNKKINWKLFEKMFALDNLRGAKNDWMKLHTTFHPNGYADIDKFFE
ncbi:hypothetical protein [Bacteroides sp. 224]|uniref:hypothetical protein n=1 Tax=Bacteroides sp. 224 TaxID=2302936 RepID=UPI0013D11716|nr:hypothetical protein [Bacteroides sp. 224]